MASARGVLGVQGGGCGGGSGSGRFKRALLRNLILGLRKGGVASREMGFRERKDAVKRAADAALASARGVAPCWSRSLAADVVAQQHRLPGTANSSNECCKAAAAPRPSSPRKMIFCKKILRRSLRPPRPGNATASNTYGASVVARAMLRKRTSVLKEIVPGGKALDVCTLMEETLDYAMSLKAQVDVMQLLVRILQEQNAIALEKQ
ncbi:hypothetical protein ABZP36_031394 [Zizania latifolia]